MKKDHPLLGAILFVALGALIGALLISARTHLSPVGPVRSDVELDAQARNGH